MPPVARGSAAPTTTMQGSHYLRLELERSDRADNNEGVDWTGLDWAHAASGVFCDALPSSSPLAFALLALGRHLINLYLAFTQIRMAISLNSLCLCPESCWLKCITQCICTLALLHCPERTCTVCKPPQHLIGPFAPSNGQSGLQQDPSPTARTN